MIAPVKGQDLNVLKINYHFDNFGVNLGGMTAKEQRFCDEYLIDLNATQAAIRAGYSKKSSHAIGYENLIKPYIQEYLSNKRLELAAKTGLTQEWVLNRFKEISDRCMTAEPVMARGEGGVMVETGEYEFDSAGANKATEMIGKHLGFFEKDNKQGEKDVKAIISITIVNAENKEED